MKKISLWPFLMGGLYQGIDVICWVLIREMGQFCGAFARDSVVEEDDGNSMTDSKERNIPEKRHSKELELDPNDFLFYNILGWGSYGRVIRVRDKKIPPSWFAMKILDKERIVKYHGAQHLARMKRERSFLEDTSSWKFHGEKLRNPYLIYMYDQINTKNRIYLLLDLCRGGDLDIFIQENGPVEESTAKIFIAELFIAVSFLHAYGIIHRDIRPQNILLQDDGHLMLSDLGIAARSSASLSSSLKRHTTIIGAAGYKAPEMVDRDFGSGLQDGISGYDFSVDYWNIGIVLYELLFGKHPFSNGKKRSQRHLREKSRVEEYDTHLLNFPESNPVSDEAKDLILKLLEINPNMRLGWRRKLDLRKMCNQEIGDGSVEINSSFLISGSSTSTSEDMRTVLDQTVGSDRSSRRVKRVKDATISEDKELSNIQMEVDSGVDNDDDNCTCFDEDENKIGLPLPSKKIREHPFFKNIDWIALGKKEMESPLKKKIEAKLTPLDPSENPHYETHRDALEEFEKRDPAAIMAAVFA